MTVQDLFRILLEIQEVKLYSHKLHRYVWNGMIKDMPNCFFDNLVSSLYSLNDTDDSYLRINIVD